MRISIFLSNSNYSDEESVKQWDTEIQPYDWIKSFSECQPKHQMNVHEHFRTTRNSPYVLLHHWRCRERLMKSERISEYSVFRTPRDALSNEVTESNTVEQCRLHLRPKRFHRLIRLDKADVKIFVRPMGADGIPSYRRGTRNSFKSYSLLVTNVLIVRRFYGKNGGDGWK